MRFGKIKADPPVPLPHMTPGKKNRKIVSSEGQENSHTSIIIDPK